MKLTPDQKAWFSTVQREWREKLQPTSSKMASHLFEVVERTPEAAVRNARLYGSRIAALERFPVGGIVAEVGTQAGFFARRLLDEIDPERLDLFDLEFNTLRSNNPEVATDTRVRLHLGDSSTLLADQADASFDLIYIDGDHALDGVRRDASCSVRKIKPDGMLVFNDYTIWSPLEMDDYGVVPVVNAMLASGEWEVVYLALHPLMYCDIAIRRTR